MADPWMEEADRLEGRGYSKSQIKFQLMNEGLPPASVQALMELREGDIAPQREEEESSSLPIVIAVVIFVVALGLSGYLMWRLG